MIRGKKSQAALEFLMTYGWAILIVLIVISALAYFGVLSPQRLLPPRCTFPTGLSCKDYMVKSAPLPNTGNNITLTILNGMGQGILVTRINSTPMSGNPMTKNCSYTPPAGGWGGQPNTLHIGNAEAVTLELMCPADTIKTDFAGTDNKYRWTIDIVYYSDDSTTRFAKTVAGELLTTVEK